MDFRTRFEVVDCASCNFQFALPIKFIGRCRLDHEKFTCPSCGAIIFFPKQPDIEEQREKFRKLRASLKSVEKSRDHALGEVECVERRRAAALGLATKRKNRIEELIGGDSIDEG